MSYMPKIDLSERVTITALMRSMVKDVAAIAATAPDPWQEKDIEALIGSEQKWCFVALMDDEPVGFATFLTVHYSSDLQLIAVKKEYQGRGVGRALLMHGMIRLKEAGVQRVLLEVRVSNKPALRLYEKVGFQNMALRKGLFSKPYEDGYLMAIQLWAKAEATPKPTEEG